MSAQFLNLLIRYGAKDEHDLLVKIAAEYTEECCDPGDEPFTVFDAELMLDSMLEAEYQRLMSASSATCGAVYVSNALGGMDICTRSPHTEGRHSW